MIIINGERLNRPDEIQLEIWALNLGMSVESLVKTFMRGSYNSDGGFWIRGGGCAWDICDGSITHLKWDFKELPINDFYWVPGMKLNELSFFGKATALISPILPELQLLSCHGNSLEVIDLSGVTSLTQLNCSKNKLTELDLSCVPQLYELNCSDNNIDHLDIGSLVNLTMLNCSNNSISSLSLSGAVSLYDFDCSGNELMQLDLNNLPSLSRLYCSRNKLRSIDASMLPDLEVMDISYNDIKEFPSKLHSGLVSISCSWNAGLSNIDLSLAPKLENITCNKDIKLDLSKLDFGRPLQCNGTTYYGENLDSLDDPLFVLSNNKSPE